MGRGKKMLEDVFGEFEDMSELVDAVIDRVDLVGKAANGHRFILAKSDSSNLIPAEVVRDFITKANEEDMPTDVIEAEVVKEDLDANVILEDATVDGDAEVPGSAAWESVDAATAAKWTAILARAKNAICELKNREKEEIEAGVEHKDDQIDDLHDAVDAIEYAIDILAPFAANEAGEVDAAVMSGIEKSVAGLKKKDIKTLEELGEVVKAGRALSSANEKTLRSAVESIMSVLDSLPVAKAEEVVAEVEAPVEAEVVKDRLEEIVDMAIESVDEVVKAEVADLSDDELARVALTGVDAERADALKEIGLRALTAHMKHEAAETPVEEAAEEAADDVEFAEEAPVAEVADDVEDVEDMPAESPEVEEELEPAPADEVGTPAGEVQKAHKLKKSVKAKKVEKLVKEARDEESGKYAAIIKSLEDRIATLEAPAPSRVLTNGALPPAHLMRGQDAGASALTDASALRKEMDDAPDAVTKSEAQERMRVAALEALSALRSSN